MPDAAPIPVGITRPTLLLVSSNQPEPLAGSGFFIALAEIDRAGGCHSVARELQKPAVVARRVLHERPASLMQVDDAGV